MRLKCFIQGGCRFDKILKEEWIRPIDPNDLISLLRFSECIYCKNVRATITHPEDYKSRWSIAKRADHRSINENQLKLAIESK
jgi:hypothetical protein